uniref:Uncharacterized protein n=1 Tax=Aegilops tauschii subsp. strangulata TaxID=200361 RepID=A0A453ESR7_AEGTS
LFNIRLEWIHNNENPLWIGDLKRILKENNCLIIVLIGDVIVAVIKDAFPKMPLERLEVIRDVIVRTCKEFKCEDGIIIRYDDNVAVIIDQKGNPKGTRLLRYRSPRSI